jgi:hypothetical protein
MIGHPRATTEIAGINFRRPHIQKPKRAASKPGAARFRVIMNEELFFHHSTLPDSLPVVLN